ncbi:MAG: ThiF family adenylyltransferase [Candidatus Heimdallarchaeota archaeon]
MVKEKLKNWKQSYWNQISRNIGLINIEDQEILRKTNIAVFGLGGLGGPLVEQLVRSGCENLLICDNDKFEPSNLNRQLCTKKDIGKYKVDVIEVFLKSINPDQKLKKVREVNGTNLETILNNIAITVLTLDDPITSILIARQCCKNKIPLLESWAIPYLFALWFTEKSAEYESFYGFKTQNMSIQELIKSKDVLLEIKINFLKKLTQFPGIKERYNREEGAYEALLAGKIPLVSFAPIVRITASYLAFEVIFTGILKIKKMNLAPNIIGYDYFNMSPINL